MPSSKPSFNDMLSGQRLPSRHDSEITWQAREPVCEICDDVGWFTNTHPRYAGVQPCPACEAGQRAYEEWRPRAWKQAGIPKLFRDFTFDDFPVDAPWMDGKHAAVTALRLVAKYRGKPFEPDAIYRAANVTEVRDGLPRPGVLVTGNYGVGKTVAAAALANALLDSRMTVRYARIVDILTEYRDTYHRNSERTSAEVRELLLKPHVLILDEFTSGVSLGRDMVPLMELIIGARHQDERPMIILTNDVDMQTIIETWGAKIASRIAEACHQVVMGGVMMRQMGEMIG